MVSKPEELQAVKERNDTIDQIIRMQDSASIGSIRRTCTRLSGNHILHQPVPVSEASEGKQCRVSGLDIDHITKDSNCDCVLFLEGKGSGRSENATWYGDRLEECGDGG
jgi:hypothetical protein